MKQTNNAIKFLMAQYRAIYQSAYFKGLATAGATALTLGLAAAGQVQAADLDHTALGTIEGGAVVEIPTAYDKINITETASNDKKFTINLSTASGEENKVEGVTVSAAKANLTLKGDKTTLKVAAGKDEGKLVLNNLNLEKGSIELAATAQKATLEANRISLASGSSITAASTGAGVATLGGAKTVFSLGSGSEITLGESGTMTGSKLISDKGTVILNSGKLEVPTYYKGDASAKAQTLNLTVASGKSGTIALKDNGENIGVLDLAKGSVVDIQAGTTATTLKITDNGNKGSLVIFNDDVVLKSSKNDASATTGGTINVSGSAAGKEAELHVAGKVLGGFLAPDAASNSAAGTLELEGNSVLRFIGSTNVDIAADASKADGTAIKVSGTAGAGCVHVKGATTIDGENLTISKALTGLATNLDVKADNLTLGKSDAHYDGTTTLGAKSITAKNLKFVDKQTFVLKDTVTLKNVKADPTDPNKFIAQEGKLEGPVIVADAAKPLTVDGGKFTSTGEITISGGKILVQNTGSAYASHLIAKDGSYILDRGAASGEILVSGTGTLMDVSNATLKYKDENTATNNVKITVQTGGEFKAKGDDIAKLLGDGSKSGAVFDIQANSKVTATGNLTLTTPTLLAKTVGTNAQIVLADSGTLAVADTLEIQQFATAGLELNNNSTLQAGILKLTLADGDKAGNAAVLKNGHYVVTKGLETNSEKGITVSGSDAKFEFVGVSTNGKVSTGLGTGGTVASDVLISGGKASVTSGKWTLSKKLTLSGAGSSLIVGNEDTVVDAEGATLGAALGVENLIIKEGSATVKAYSSLDVTNINSIGKGVELYGSMSIAGKYDNTKSDAFEKFGIKLADNAITMKTGSSLTLKGAGVEKALGAVESGGKITNFNVDSGGAFATGGALKSEAGSTLNVTYFKKDTVFTKEALKALSDGLFGTNPDNLKGSINLGDVKFDGLSANKDNEVLWSVVEGYGVNYLLAFKNKELMGAVLVQDKTNPAPSALYGHWGAVKDEAKANGTISFAENASLNKATDVNGKKYFAVGKDGALLGLDVAKNGTLTLANGGMVGATTIQASGSLVIDSKAGNTTEFVSISGGDTTKVFLASGKAVVSSETDGLKAGYMIAEEGTDLHIKGSLTLINTNADEKTPSVFAGKVTVDKNVSLQGDTTFAGVTSVSGDFSAAKNVTFSSQAEIKGTANFSGDKTSVVKGGILTTKHLALASQDDNLFIGSQLKEGEGDKAKYTNSFGYLDAKSAELKSGSFLFNGESVGKSSIGAINYFGTAPKDIEKITDAGTLDGNLVIGNNSALMVGPKASIDEMQYLYYRTGGASMYLKDKLTVAATDARIILDAGSKQEEIIKEMGKTNDSKYAAAWQGATTKTASDLYLGAGATLFINQNVLTEDAAIKFEKNDAAILAEKGSKVVLDGDRFISSREINLFKDAGTNGNDGVKILGTKGKNDIVVESINGIMGFTLEAGETTKAGTLELLKDKIDSAYRGASTPMRDYLISYASLTKNWQAYYSKDPDNNNGTAVDSSIDRDYLVSHEANANEATVDAQGVITAQQGFHASQFVAVKQKDGKYKVFHKAFNEFLEKVVRDTNGLAADQAARMGVFGGAAEAAMMVGNSTYEAISGRFGMGHQGQLMTYANNGQGGAMWTAPVYKSRETSDFEAQGLGYGTDTSIKGLVLGGDFTFDDGMRYGAVLNLGEGDSSGEGAANGVSGEFKYYGLGLYAGFNYQAFSVVADLGYSVIDTDVEANTDAGKVSGSFDATNLSAGITGQVNLSFRTIDIVPHIGARFSRIKLDDYSISNYGHVTSSEANLFSLPAGVTISKEYFSEEWSFQPSIDFNVTGHFGDDSLDSTVYWKGVNNSNVALQNDFMDNGVSYGVLVGFGAQSERLSVGAGLGYQGSSNVDEFTLNGSFRYTF